MFLSFIWDSLLGWSETAGFLGPSGELVED
jgi:hypothetical protein